MVIAVFNTEANVYANTRKNYVVLFFFLKNIDIKL